ncbi:MAG: sugar transporter [Verrucomicrobiales bacterium]|nr:sugar transporter [Verrucomicrobiales bacterium]
MSEHTESSEIAPLRQEKFLLFILAAIQFTTIVDFLIVLPLGPQYMRVFKISPAQFGLMVSAYAISAGIFGIIAGFFLDRFDRKRALLWLYSGFTLGTLCCALAPNYHLLVAARVVAGAFGGVAGGLILAIIGDVIPEKRRGAAMGLVMSSFSVASICGVPLGLLLASHLNWHMPFFALTGLSILILAAAARVMPHLRSHLVHAGEEHPAAKMLTILTHPDHRMAFVFMATMTCAGFLVFPYISNYMVANVGMTEKQLPLIYLCGGLCTLFTMNLIGRWTDRAGKKRVFTIVSLSAAAPIVILTNLPHAPVWVAVAVSTLLMVCMSGRMVPAMALMTGSIEARYRGGFMSINSSVQQFASGFAAYVSGLILGQTPGGEITRYWLVGVLSVTCAYSCIYLVKFLKTSEVPNAEKIVAME